MGGAIFGRVSSKETPNAVEPGVEGTGPADSDRVAVRRTRVLVVDDEPMLGTTLKVVLSPEHDVAVTTSAKSAMALLEHEKDYDVILCDLVMPGMSGMDLHRWLFERDPAAAGRMIFMSGGAFTADAREFLESVPNTRVDKPFDAPELLRVIRERSE